MNQPSRALRPTLFYLIVGIIFAADQLSKLWIQHVMLPDAGSQPILGSAFQLTLTHNTGGAWGLLPSGNVVFIVFALLAVVALLFAYHRMQREILVGAAFALALGGALGNLLDRLRWGYVVDFFDARIIHWPIFNIADSAITFGILLLLLHFFRAAHEETRSEAVTPARSAAGTLATEDAVGTPPE